MMENKAARVSEDWLSVWIGGLIFALALLYLSGLDLIGWAVKSEVWTDITASFVAVSSNYGSFLPVLSLLLTYLFLLLVMTLGAAGLGADIRRFGIAFTAVFFLSYLCRIIGSWGYIAATPRELETLGISWSLNLTAEAGYIVALLMGLAIGNFLPGWAAAMKEAVRPELYVKTAIVILGGTVGVKAAEQLGLAGSLLVLGLCAIIAAYLIYWAVVYLVARTYFKFNREWAVPLASGVSICGVSAAIATGAAIRARPVVPIMVSSLVVIFAVVELLMLPFLAQTFLYQEPMVAGAWMGLTVKTDGAAVASGALTESLIAAKAVAVDGIQWEPGWVVGTTATVKVFIDVFIGVWAFILAWIWSAKIEPTGGRKIGLGEIWLRFPKFVLGYLGTFVLIIGIGVFASEWVAGSKTAMGHANVFRGIFFSMTFFTIGVVSNFRKLWEEGIARLAAVYILCLFGFIIWVGLAIAWAFFYGIKPPQL